METIFKVGDRVFNIQYGWGVISDIYSEMIIVKFNGIQYGFLNVNNKTLSFTEYTLQGFSQERPEDLPSRGDIVWVRDTDVEDWTISHFLDYEPNHLLPYVASMDVTIRNAFNYVQMTTKNPYANELYNK